MESSLLTRVENRIGYLTINLPETMNAMLPEDCKQLIAAVDALDQDDEVNVLVVTGVGKAFCSGGNLEFIQTVAKMSPEEIKRIVYDAYLGAVKAFKLCSKPVIASVNGPAIGFGCELALACDFRVIANTAYMCEGWIELGTLPVMGGMFVLPRLIGLERAASMVMRGTRVGGAEAKMIGLATEAVDFEELASATRILAEDLARRPRNALAFAKQSLRRSVESSLAVEEPLNLLGQTMLIKGPSHAELVAAMVARIKKRG